MIRRVALLSAALIAAAGLLTVSPAVAREAELQQAEAQREILVMVKMSPPHYRPGGAYGGAYGSATAQSARKHVARSIGREFMLEVVDSWPMPLLGVDCFIMRILDERPMEAVIAAVSSNANVAWSQPVNTYFTRSSPDPLYLAQPTVREWRLDDLHRIATGRGVKIAVVDSKVEARHPDLVGQVSVERDFIGGAATVAEEHGTGIAGVIAAKAGNGLGIAGVAPQARLMALRACSQRTSSSEAACSSLALAKALQFAIENGADIVNLSLSGPPDRLLASLIGIGLERRIAFVSAYDPRLPRGGFPASVEGVLPISDESLASVPAGVYLAPGRDIPVTRPGGKWGLASGSSFATAQVSGLLALAKEGRRRSASPLLPSRSGNGLVDACATLLPMSAACDCDCSMERRVAKGK